MMPALNKTILLPLLLAAATAQAGSTDGLNIAAIAHPSAQPYTGSVSRFLANHASHGISCGDYALNLEHVYTAGLPRQLTSDLALAAVKDRAQRKKLGKILTSFRDKTLERGFDGALAYEVQGAQLRFYGISAAAGEDVVVSTLPVADAKDQKRFDIAACKALASLPVLAEP